MTEKITKLFNADTTPHETLSALIPALGEALACDRCLLFLRHPGTGMSRMTHGWTAKPEYALQREDHGWQPQSPTLIHDDPMFAEALRNPEALFIDDIENADPALVDASYELKHFGHRALVHAPIYHDGGMYGILEPCVFARSRHWSDADRALVAGVQEKISPIVAAYVHEECA